MGKLKPFDPQGESRPVNMPGLTGMGKRAVMRSEDAEHEKARREILANPPYSIIGAMINPNGASLNDAIRGGAIKRLKATGGYKTGDYRFDTQDMSGHRHPTQHNLSPVEGDNQ